MIILDYLRLGVRVSTRATQLNPMAMKIMSFPNTKIIWKIDG